MSSANVRKAREDELPAVREVLARAFDDDPPMNWTLRRDEGRARAFATFFEIVVDLTFPHGEVYCDDHHRGAALWTPPGRWNLRWHQHLRDLPRWGRAIGWTRLPFVAAGAAALTGAHPHQPHYYLLSVGVDPSYRGRGLARALLEPVLARCDQERVPAYLEASTPGVVPLYERLGFVVQREVRLGADGPPLILMWRAAR